MPTKMYFSCLLRACTGSIS